MKNRIQTLLTTFARTAEGGIAIMAGFMIPIVSLGIIAAVDITDMREDKREMQDRLDAALLYATADLDQTEPNFQKKLQDKARKFVLEAVADMKLDARQLKTNFYYDETADRVKGEVAFHSPAIFLGSGFMNRDVVVRAEAAPREATRLEMSLILDLSGSMRWYIDSTDTAPVGSRRIDALREGVDSLLASIDGKPNLKAEVSVIPYATSVDLTGLLHQASGQASTFFESLDGSALPDVCEGSAGLGDGLANGRCGIDISKIDGVLGSALYPNATGAWGAERYVAKVGSSFTLNLAAPTEPGRIPVVTQPSRGTRCSTTYTNWYGTPCMETVTVDGVTMVERDYFAPRSGLLPLTDDTDTVRTFMGTLEPEGGTAGHIGTAWGLYALTPEWHPVFKHPTGQPDQFDSATKKVMVVMTDGAFKNSHDPTVTVAETYDYFQQVCSLARAQGVLVYAVGLRSSPETDTELTECAGSAARYYPANSRSDLIDAFEDIIENVSLVRLSG